VHSFPFIKKLAFSDAVLFWLLCCVHCVAGVCLKIAYGIDSETNIGGPGVWDYCWQMLPSEVLQHHLLQGIWFLHAQPPLYNLLGGIAYKLFYPHHCAALQWLNIGLGSLASAMIYTICKAVFKNRIMSFCTALFLAFNPAVFLYEANALYDFMCLFLIILSGYCLIRYCQKRTAGALIGFCAGVNALILTRSLYNIILLVPLALLLCIITGRRAKKSLVVFSLFGMLSVGWYAKNAVMFGFFGSSSWLGMNLFNQVSFHLWPRQMAQAGCDPLVIDKGVFLELSDYAPYGFTATSGVPSLAGNDMHNVNIIAISNVYLKNSLRLIRRYPVHYLKNMLHGYFIFCKPSTRMYDLTEYVVKIGIPVGAWEWLEGRIDWPWCAWTTNAVIFLPLSLILICLLLMHEKRRTAARWYEVLRTNAAVVYIVIMVCYTTTISSMFELWENNRFKFPVEQFIWILVLYSVFETVRLFRGEIAEKKTTAV
jgi:hypothetical protein